MMKNKEAILNLIKETKESLRILKETQAFDNLIKKAAEYDELLTVNIQKKFEDLLKQEKSAVEAEDFVEYKKTKEEQKEAARKLILIFDKKKESYQNIYEEIIKQIEALERDGDSVFKDKEINEFKNDEFEMGQKIKIVTNNSETIISKSNDNNVYEIMNTTIPGLIVGDFLKMPDLKLGGGGKVTVYKKTENKYEEVKQFDYENVKKIIKNPR